MRAYNAKKRPKHSISSPYRMRRINKEWIVVQIYLSSKSEFQFCKSDARWCITVIKILLNIIKYY